MEEEDFVHRKGAPENALIDLAGPRRGRFIAQFVVEWDRRSSFREPRWGVDVGLGKPFGPFSEEEMMEFVWSHDMPDGSEVGDFAFEFWRKGDGRPDPEAAVFQFHDGHSRRVGYAEKGDGGPFGYVDGWGKGFQHEGIL